MIDLQSKDFFVCVFDTQCSVTSLSTLLAKFVGSAPRYSQKDRRWSNPAFGKSVRFFRAYVCEQFMIICHDSFTSSCFPLSVLLFDSCALAEENIPEQKQESQVTAPIQVSCTLLLIHVHASALLSLLTVLLFVLRCLCVVCSLCFIVRRSKKEHRTVLTANSELWTMHSSLFSVLYDN